MRRHNSTLTAVLLVTFAAAFPSVLLTAALAGDAQPPGNSADALFEDVTQGALRVKKPDGQIVECPLKHTDVKADISGFKS